MRLTAILASCAFLLASCGEDGRVAGNGGDIGNAVTSGIVVRPDGTPAHHALVKCRPVGHRPWEDRPAGWTTRTDSAGRYTCRELPRAAVGITAFDPRTGLTHWRSDTARPETSVPSSIDTLARSGTLRVALAPATSGTLWLSGTDRFVTVHGEETLGIEDVPAGWSGSLLLATSASTNLVIDSNLDVPSGSLDSAGFTRSSSALRLRLPGGLAAPVRSFPLLVRLDSTWPGFANSLADGSDLRLSDRNGKSLPLTLASWDKAGRKGSLWTFLDSLPAPGDSIDLILERGLPVRSAAPAAAFAAGGSWSAVWPLGDTGSTVVDRLGRFPGTAVALGTAQGIAGKASRFDGSGSKVVVKGSATGPLAFAEGGPYTLSCWVRLRQFTYSRFVMGFGDRNSALKYQGNTSSSNRNTWQVQDFRNVPMGKHFTYGPADTAVWTHLATTVDGDSVRLFLDGVRQTAPQGFDRSDIPKSVVDFALGASLDSLGTSSYHFPGELSEAWVHSAARSADWIRFAAANQSPSAAPAHPVP